MPVITNFGDVTTQGNTTLQQNLTVQGASATFTGSILAASSAVGIGNAASRFGAVWAVAANTTTLNATSFSGTTITVSNNVFAANAIQTTTVLAALCNTTTVNAVSLIASSNIGIGTTPVAGGANLYVVGNIYASNALTTQLVTATSGNVTNMNTVSLTSTANIGVGTTPVAGGPNFYVVGNIYASNALTTQLVTATSGNVSTINAVSLITASNIGVGTTPVTGGPTVHIIGNVTASNAITTTNLNVTNNGNFGSINVLSILGQTGFIGVNTTDPSGTSLRISGNLQVSNGIFASNLYVTSANVTTLNINSLFSPTGYVGVNTDNPSGTTLYVLGNMAVATTMTTTNLNATLANVSTLNTTAIVSSTGFTGINTTDPSGTTVRVLGNVAVATAISTPAISTTSLNVTSATISNIYGLTGSVAVNNTGALGATLYVLGNVYASNALWTTNISTTNFNTGSINVMSIYGQSGFVGVNTTLPSGSSLRVDGNVSVSNAVSTQNVIATTLNVISVANLSSFVTGSIIASNINLSNGLTAGNVNATTFNTTTLYTTSTVGLSNWTVANIAASNAVQTTNVIASGTLQYSEDLNKRAPYLAPSAANSAAILNWISSTCNAADQPTASWWATSPRPVYGNVATGPRGTADYAGSVLLPDGRVLFVPQNASNVGFYNPRTLLFSTVSPVGLPPGASKFGGGVLCPNGNVVFIPGVSANIGLFNSLTYIYSNITVGASAGTGGNQVRFQGGVLSPTGNVIMIPRDSANIGVFNPTTLTMTNVGPIYGGAASLFAAGVLLPNGNVVMTPLNSGQGANIGIYNSYSLSTSAFTNVGPMATAGVGTWQSAVLAPNGNVVFIPSASTNAVVYNPISVSNPLTPSAYTNISAEARSGGTNAFLGGALLPSGNIICAPYESRNVGMIDPVALTYSNSTPVGGGSKFMGCSLTISGQVVFAPASAANVGVLNTMVPAPQEFCMNPLFNKF
jgi:hypothetical protein